MFLANAIEQHNHTLYVRHTYVVRLTVSDINEGEPTCQNCYARVAFPNFYGQYTSVHLQCTAHHEQSP